MSAWRSDVLPGWRRLDLAPAAGGALVRRAQGHDRAVVLAPGFNDYVFQDHLAELLLGEGWDVVGVDPRLHGRALRPGDDPSRQFDLGAWRPELSAALAEARRGRRTVVLLGHSTGGLACALHGARYPAEVDGLVLNSPLLRLVARGGQRLLLGLARMASRVDPNRIGVPAGDARYARSLLRSLGDGGEWDYDPAWKRPEGLDVRFGWVAAVLRAQAELRPGCLPMPTLTLCSGRHEDGDFGPAWFGADAVLDPDDMRRLAPGLGPDSTVRTIHGAMHDVFLSRPAAREEAWGALRDWLGDLDSSAIRRDAL